MLPFSHPFHYFLLFLYKLPNIYSKRRRYNLDRLLAEKKIRAFRIGKKWKITKASIENYLAENSH